MGFGHDQGEQVAQQVDLAGQVIVGDALEMAAFFLGEEGGVDGGGVRGHANSFQAKNRTYVLLLYAIPPGCQGKLKVCKKGWLLLTPKEAAEREDSVENRE